MLRPEYYTEREFPGIWEKWPDFHEFVFDWLHQRSATNVRMGMLQVHALAFDDPAIGIGRFLRWDCVNGFDNLNNQPRNIKKNICNDPLHLNVVSPSEQTQLLSRKVDLHYDELTERINRLENKVYSLKQALGR